MRMLGLLASVSIGTVALGQETFVDTFEDGLNEGGWAFQGDGSVSEGIQPFGGNPGAFLRDIANTVAPISRSAGDETPFSGDFLARWVSEVRVDLRVLGVNFVEVGTPTMMMLIDRTGEIHDIPDWWGPIWGAYVLGPPIPKVADGWVTYEFEVPSQVESLPRGWTFYKSPPDGPADWQTLMARVDEVRFAFACPEEILPFQVWDVGMDNASITFGCAADFNGDGELDILDFIALQNAFVGRDEGADVNGDGALDVLDFVAFQELFVAGC